MIIIAEILGEWKEECNYKKSIQFNYSHLNGVLTICTPSPGWLIGKAGCHINKYTEILKSKFNSFESISFVETADLVI